MRWCRIYTRLKLVIIVPAGVPATNGDTVANNCLGLSPFPPLSPGKERNQTKKHTFSKDPVLKDTRMSDVDETSTLGEEDADSETGNTSDPEAEQNPEGSDNEDEATDEEEDDDDDDGEDEAADDDDADDEDEDKPADDDDEADPADDDEMTPDDQQLQQEDELDGGVVEKLNTDVVCREDLQMPLAPTVDEEDLRSLASRAVKGHTLDSFPGLEDVVRIYVHSTGNGRCHYCETRHIS